MLAFDLMNDLIRTQCCSLCDSQHVRSHVTVDFLICVTSLQWCMQSAKQSSRPNCCQLWFRLFLPSQVITSAKEVMFLPDFVCLSVSPR